MAVTAQWYPQGQGAINNGDVDWDDVAGQDVKLALMGTGYTYDDTHDFWDDISANEYGGTGYTAGGTEIANRAIVETDSSGLTARANSTAYVLGDVVRTATDSGRAFLCVSAGTSDASEPAGMATLGSFREITDSGCVWANLGRAVTILDGDAVTFSGLDGTTETIAAVVYKDTGVASTSPLLMVLHFGATETPTQITVTPPGEGYGIGFSGADL